jgi:hypothetical protein
MSLLNDIPAAAIPIVNVLVKLIADLVRADGDEAAQIEALMEAEAKVAREAAFRKFGPRPPQG